jgi:hypothetical protein
MNTTSRPGPGEREELARLVPAPVERDLPNGRHRLLKEHVMTQIRQEPQSAVPPPRRRSRRRVLTRRRVVAGAVVAAAAVTAVVLGPLGPGSRPGRLGPQPAYAVTSDANGTVTVRIHGRGDPAQLVSALARRGIRADVAFVDRPGTKRLDTNGGKCVVLKRPDAKPIRTWPIVPGKDQQFKIIPSLVKKSGTVFVRIYPKEIRLFVGEQAGQPCTASGKPVPQGAPTRASTSGAPGSPAPSAPGG